MRRLLTLLLAAAVLIAGCQAKPEPTPEPPAATEPEAGPAPQPQVDSPPAPTLPADPEPLPVIPPSVVVSPAQVQQGDFTVLELRHIPEGGLTIEVEGLGEQPRPFTLGDRQVAFIGFPAAAQVRSYPITVTWDGGSWEGSVAVLHKQFTEDRLVVTEEQTDLYYDPRQEADWAKVFKVRSTSEPRPLWRGPFQAPLADELRITTYFGEIRFVNGAETGRHSGMDFGAPTGTPILAPARGKVVLAEHLIVTGWTIIIDHGMNLYTTYYHCDRLDVSPGDWVEPGQTIGLVGNTGFSTGPHLHWTATIGNTPVDPWPLTLEAPLGVTPLVDRLPAHLEE